MKAIELFAGIGGFRLGLEANEINVIWANEWDKYAADTYDKNFKAAGHAINRQDITTVDVSDIPAHDLLVGGFPCQAFSVAGKRRGFDETRGTLFFDVARIIGDKRPAHFILENVQGLLNHEGGQTFQTILRVLADMGYRVEWQLLNSTYFGVPQNRERVYIVGHLAGRCSGQILPIAGEEQTLVDAEIGTIAYDRYRSTGNRSLTITANYWKGHDNHGQRPMIKTAVKGLSQKDRVYEADGISPTLDTGKGGVDRQSPKIKVVSATKAGYEEATVGDGINLGAAGSSTRWGRVQEQAAQTLDTSGAIGTYDGDRIRRLTPIECERLQGFPDDWTAGVSDTQRYKQCGNAVTVNVVREVAKRLIIHHTSV